MKSQVLLILIIFWGILYSQKEHVDGIVAWVESNPILKSEVLQAVQMDVMQRGIDLSLNPYYVEDNFDDYLEMLINQYVMFENAKKDTLIEVTGDEINLTLENEVELMIQRAGSLSSLEDILGQPVQAYKMDAWGEIEKRLLIDKYQQSFLFNVDISRPEVLSFYEEYSDSLSPLPARSSFSVIELPIQASHDAEVATIDFLTSLRDSIISGASFEEMATKYSQDPGSNSNGGSLGFIKRGTLVNQFEEAAFSLEVNKISTPIKTEFGFHLIQVLSKQGEKVNVRHILQRITPSIQDISIIEQSIRSIYQQCENDFDAFDSLAYFFQNKHQNMSAVYDWIPDVEINPFIYELMEGAEDDSGLFFPQKKSDESYILLLVKDRRKSEKATLENAWQLIETMAKNQKTSKEFELWIKREKEDVFISKL